MIAKQVVVVSGVIGIVYLSRRRLVHLLSRFTGTWIGTPDA